MKNQLQRGEAIDVVVPSGGFVSGNPYLIGAALFGVAGVTASQGATAPLWTTGAFSLPKISSQVWAVGDKIYWSIHNNACSNVNSSSDQAIGVAIAAAANPSATGAVKLTGQV